MRQNITQWCHSTQSKTSHDGAMISQQFRLQLLGQDRTHIRWGFHVSSNLHELLLLQFSPCFLPPIIAPLTKRQGSSTCTAALFLCHSVPLPSLSPAGSSKFPSAEKALPPYHTCWIWSGYWASSKRKKTVKVSWWQQQLEWPKGQTWGQRQAGGGRWSRVSVCRKGECDHGTLK